MVVTMSRYDDLMARIASGEKVLIDGATGSEMDRRGVQAHDNGWLGGAALSDPNVLRDVPAEYISIGANLIISNTFATHRTVLRDAGAEEDFEASNRRSVELCVEARDAGDRPDVVVAAGISHWSFIDNDPSLDEQERNATEQCLILANAGAELIILEMMVSIERMKRLIAAAKTTGLPVWVGFAVGGEAGELPDPNAMSLRTGELLTEAVQSLEGLGIDLINIMHTDVALIDQCLDDMFAHWDGPIGVYAHSWPENDVISPGDYAVASRRWLDRGVCLIGGCCGTEPSHIVELAKLDGVH